MNATVLLIGDIISIDRLDETLLHALKSDSRRSIRELASDIEESPSTVYNRIKKLEEKNIIRRWTICYDYEKLGLGTIAYVFVGLKIPPNVDNGLFIRNIAYDIAELKPVFEVHIIAGEYDLILKIRSHSLKSIGKFVIHELRSMPEVEETMTTACFDTVLEEGHYNQDILPSEQFELEKFK